MPSRNPSNAGVKRWRLPMLLSVGLAYYLAARYGLALMDQPGLLSAVWPASGIGLAAVLYNRRLLLSVAVACLLLFVPRLYHSDLGWIPSALLSSGLSLAFSVEAWLGVWLIRRWSAPGRVLANHTELAKFAAAMALTAAVTASLTTLVCYSAGVLPGYGLLAWLVQWLASTAGLAVFTPLLLSWRRYRTSDWSPGRIIEGMALLAGFCLVLPFALHLWSLVWLPIELPILLLPILLWAAFRFALRETAVLIGLLALVAYQSAQLGLGLVQTDTLLLNLASTQALLIILSLSVLAVAANTTASRRNQKELLAMNQQLEKRVLARTTQLARNNRELQNYKTHLEARVAERTADLELANREIESFSYSVSHDLRSPLRAIDGYSHALLEEYADKLDTRGLDYLQRTRKASQRMGILIDDVLLLSRVTRHELEMQTINLTELARKICQEIKLADGTQRDVQFVIQDDLQIEADGGLLRIALENLIGNAWKYTAKRKRSIIEFGSLPNQPTEYVFYVKDNGIGFDMRYAEKLFGAFQRLHNSDEFAGTGIGLATVARIMQRHGGQVWTEAQPDLGASFFIGFPRRARTTGPRKSVIILDDEPTTGSPN